MDQLPADQLAIPRLHVPLLHHQCMTVTSSFIWTFHSALHLDISLRPSSGHFGFTDVAELTLDFGNVFNFNFENNRGIMNYFIDPVTLICFEEGFTSMHDGAQTSPKVTI